MRPFSPAGSAQFGLTAVGPQRQSIRVPKAGSYPRAPIDGVTGYGSPVRLGGTVKLIISRQRLIVLIPKIYTIPGLLKS